MNFIAVANVFDAIEKETSRLKKTELLANLLEQATPLESSIIAYLSLGSLQPVYHQEKFNFAEKSLIRVIAQVVNKTTDQVSKFVTKLGDVGTVLDQFAVKSVSEDLTVKYVNQQLLSFLKITGTGSQERKEELLLVLLKSLDPAGAKYVVRVIAGKLRLGFSDMIMLDAFSWMLHGDKSIRKELENAYNMCADIGLIIKTLKDKGMNGIKEISITPGIPIRPAAAERLPDAAAIIEKIGPCVAQSKLDGFRLQVHVDNRAGKQSIEFFSRNMLDMSDMFPDICQAIKNLDVQTLIVEGEAIAYDTHTNTFLPFQATVKRKRKHNIETLAEEMPLRLYMFDVLYLNGVSYLEVSHHERRQLLLQLLENDAVKKHNVLFAIEERQIKTANELESYFNTTVDVGLEGLVVKRDNAPYQPGKRNYNWIKLKRQETGSLDDTLDCVVLGYYFGRGKRAKFGIGALLVGVYNEEKSVFQTVAKIGTGLTDTQWVEAKEILDSCSLASKPDDVFCAGELAVDVWCMPSVVCMIRADEITLSPLHTAAQTNDSQGYALRFPRFMGYREDKSATDATSANELITLYEMQFNKGKKPSKNSKKQSNTKEKNLKIV